MDRQKALLFLQEELKNKNLIKHSLAVEAAMKGLASHFKEDVDRWGLTGLLHDIDYEKVADDLQKHSQMGAEILQEAGLDGEICQAVLTHNEAHGIEPQGMMAKSLYCVDPLTGLIVAATLVLPSKRISALETESVLKRFKEKAFARGANREIISRCEPLLGLSLENFVEIVLKSMQEISSDLGL